MNKNENIHIFISEKSKSFRKSTANSEYFEQTFESISHIIEDKHIEIEIRSNLSSFFVKLHLYV